MKQITLYRAPGYIDMFRAYHIILDGEPVGRIKRGQRVEIDVPEGEHYLHLRIDWCLSNSVFFKTDEESTHFECGNRYDGKKLLLAPFYLLFPRGDYLWLKRVS